MAGILGFEPRNVGAKTRCLTTWLYSCKNEIQNMLPLTPLHVHYTCKKDSNLRLVIFSRVYIIAVCISVKLSIWQELKDLNSHLTVLETDILPIKLSSQNMVEADGIEPPTPVKERIYSPVQPTNSYLTSKIRSSVVRFELTLSTSTYSTIRIIQRRNGASDRI